jgi:UDP-glucose 4-epimerase
VTESGGQDAEPRRCLVIGGGLIGSATALELASRDCEVTVYSRSFAEQLSDRHAVGSGIELVEGALPQGPGLDDLVAEADLVFLLAGSSTPALSDTDAVGSITGSLEPGLAVLDAVRRGGRRRIVIASSGGTIYGRVEKTPTPEDAPLRPISLHGVNSLALEAYASFYAREHGLEPIILRYSNVYGPGQRPRGGQGVIAAWCAALRRGESVELIGEDVVRRDFLYATDAAAATVTAAFGADRPGTYNVGSGSSHRLSEVLALLGEASGAEVDVTRSPGRPIDVPVTELDCTRLAEQTGWRPEVELSRGIALTWEGMPASDPDSSGAAARGG